MKNEMTEQEFLEEMKQLWRDTEVYTLDPENEDLEPYPYEMWLRDVMDFVHIAKRF